MTEQNVNTETQHDNVALLREALQAFVDLYGDSDVRKWMDLRDRASAALSAPAQPSQAKTPASGEAVYQSQSSDGRWMDLNKVAYAEYVKHGGAPVRVLYTTPPASQEQAQPGMVQAVPSFAQLTQILGNLDRCHSRDSKAEFLRTWIRDWTQHKIEQAQPSGEVVAWGLFVRIEDGSWSLQHPVRFTQADAEADIAMYEQTHQFKVEPLTVGTAPQPAAMTKERNNHE